MLATLDTPATNARPALVAPALPVPASPFYVGDRYVANAGLAARHQQDASERAAREGARLVPALRQAFGRASTRAAVIADDRRTAAALARRIEATRELQADAVLARVAAIFGATEGLGQAEADDLLAALRTLTGGRV